MRIAIFGATSQIARDLIESFAQNDTHTLVLYARRPQAVDDWLSRVNLSERFTVCGFEAFSEHEQFDAIMNFVGVGNPAQAAAMGASIFDVTLKYDEIALDYVRQRPNCRYIFLSSGAAYGGSFDAPVDANSFATVPINNLQPQNWYGVAKLHAECRHRAMAPLPIVDIRVFNYFSHTQDIEARFLITDMMRAIRDKTVMKTSADNIVRDFIHPSDFFRLVNAILVAPEINTVIDAYSKAPIDKQTLLADMQENFGLRYEVVNSDITVNATGNKPHYYPLNSTCDHVEYQPLHTSQSVIFLEAKKIISLWG
jgi:nucleoside-diphosphate-sugar epimerase